MATNPTQLTVKNNSKQDVRVYLTLGPVPGCVQQISEIPFVKEQVNHLQGWFLLPKGNSVSYTPPQGKGFNGNFAFGTPPQNCPTKQFPSGVILAEFMINNSFQGPNSQETLDISAVDGVNALLKFSMTGGGAWNAGPTKPNVTEFENKKIGQNAGRVGVYPYACDVCIASQNPPVCPNPPIGAPNPPIPQKQAICNVQRNASQAGGTILLTFKGFIESRTKSIALQAHNGQYVCAEGGGGREVVANRNEISDWETFELIDRGHRQVALKAANGQYVCAEGGGGREVVANRDEISEWETFELIDRGHRQVALKAANGQYVCAEGGGGREVVANRNEISEWETFSI
ncbi:MAG: hypothetical protein QNJ54_28530 [Prochloraceae cyanobacterium]|nr:hypothetical protein [Prochloraceae cyanobacterium]